MKENFHNNPTLFPEKRGDPIARILKDIREHSLDVYPPVAGEQTEDFSFPENDKVKQELYGLAAYMIERIHPEAEKILREKQSEEVRVYEEFQFPQNADVKVNLLSSNFSEDAAPEDVFFLITGFAYAYSTAFIDALRNWQKKTEEFHDSYDAKVRERFIHLLSKSPRFGPRGRTPSGDFSPELFVLRGAINASSVSWDVLRSIPVAYYNQYGITITREEYTQLAESAEPLVTLLSSMHLQSFSRLSEFARAGSRVNKNMYLEFPLEFFKIEKDENNKPTLVFDVNAIKEYERYNKSRHPTVTDEKRIGCPARDARTNDLEGRPASVVSSIYRYYRELADRHLVPHLGKYTEGALELATKK